MSCRTDDSHVSLAVPILSSDSVRRFFPSGPKGFAKAAVLIGVLLLATNIGGYGIFLIVFGITMLISPRVT